MWPSLESFLAFASESGVTVSRVLGEGYLVSAAETWLKDTGFEVWTAGSVASDKWLDPGDYGSTTDFDGGFVTVDSVAVAVTPQGDTTDKTILTDYVLERANANGPYERVRWLCGRPSGFQTVLVTGRRGYCEAGTDADKDAQTAVFALALALVMEGQATSDSDVKKVTQGPVTIEYERSAESSPPAELRKFYDVKVSQYKRILI